MRFMIDFTTARIVRPIDAGDAEADRDRAHVERADGLLHHVVEDLLDFELADRLEVRAAAARFGDHRAVLVGEEADGLGAAGVDSEDVEHMQLCTESLSPQRNGVNGRLPGLES